MSRVRTPAGVLRSRLQRSASFLAYTGGLSVSEKSKFDGVSCDILVKTSVLLEGCSIAHFNFVGDSIVGHDVNIEAGAILCNHYNEREDDTVYVHVDRQRISTGLHKFGSLVGDGCRIGANAVLSPGTLLKPRTIVRRLELVEQDPS